MSYLFPRVAFTPVRCAAPATIFRHEVSPLWSLFDDATRELQQFSRAASRQGRHATPFNPRFDVKEDKESYILEGEVPGFKEQDLSIEWNDNTLAIKGRHESHVQKGQKPTAQATVEGQTQTAAIQDGTTTPASDAGSTKSNKSHQATVEDEEPTTTTSSTSTEQSADSEAQVAKTAQSEAPAKSVQEPEVQSWISERRIGQFSRQFSFPSNAVNHEAIKASLQSGILKIVVPKLAIQPSRTINIE